MRTYSTRKRILVTGGAGFLGSHLCERLLAEGSDVLCADNFFTGTKDNIAHLLPDPPHLRVVPTCGLPHFELMCHDITFPLFVEVDAVSRELSKRDLNLPSSPTLQSDAIRLVHGAFSTNLSGFKFEAKQHS